MNKKCLMISFDFTKRDEYPDIPYSVASILAQFKNADFVDIESYSFDLNKFSHLPKNKIEESVKKEFEEKYFGKIDDYSFIAIAVYSWSINLVKELIKIIRSRGNSSKIILGGYEITALRKEKLLKDYCDADFFIKGYAENALEKIFKNEINDGIIEELIDGEKLISPYLSEVLPLNTKKIYWESKRGCQYDCDFCEHGAATRENNGINGKKIIRIGNSRLEKEIEFFKKQNVKDINVLDATFLLENQDNGTLEKLLRIDSCKICLQMHFETIKNDRGKKFLAICQKHKDRISLEFGLQTIHDKEMKILNRKNDIHHVKTVMKQLNDAKIKYSISIIFGIPHQTVESFCQTIGFIEENNCYDFHAYPLQLPKNSKMREKIDELKIEEFQDEQFSSQFVKSCISFNHSEWKTMSDIAKFSENKPPFCGDPIKITPEETVELDYLNGGIRCKLKDKQCNCGKSIFWELSGFP
jgi:radical SAM superfamily enzyme YgiQ (UPF0313 family)